MNRVNWKSSPLEEKQKLYSQLIKELSLNKRQLFDTKIKTRTRHFSLAIEDMMKSQNASALLRTADAFGIQRIDIYDKNERFNVSTGISKGVEKWLDSNFFNSYSDGGVVEWASRLKATGRKLYVTALDKNAVPLSQIDPTESATICFGNEQQGASSDIRSLADKIIYIPMKGFVESFNVSVSCGIVLHHLTLGMEEAGIPWGLDEEDALNTKINWALRTIPNPLRFL